MMPAIAVLVGDEEKEISGLNRKTTCGEVIEALLQDEAKALEGSDLSDLVKNYIIVENWRGCEKPLSSKTRILAVWRAWGKEQCYVKFSLKKDKNNRLLFYQNEDESQNEMLNFTHNSFQNEQSDSSHFIHELSHGQKKRIRRRMMQYQRAVLLQRTQDRIDGNKNIGKHASKRSDRNAGDRSNSSRHKSSIDSKTKITLSEEQFVDGVPESTNRLDANNKLMQNALEFHRERCNYRRPHHRRLSLLQDDSDGVTDQNVTLTRPQNDHRGYPYSSMSKRRSRSRKQRSRHRSDPRSRNLRLQSEHKPQGSKSGTDSTASTGSATFSSDLEHDSYSEGDEADDEKSIMADFGASVPRPNFPGFTQSLLPCVETYSSGTVSASTATITDTSSATTTCSETSNISGSSFTTSSSETSIGADLELYYARKEAAKANVVEKPKSSAAKLFRMPKPQSLIGSFMRKKKTQQTPQSSNPTSNKPVQVPSTPNGKVIPKQSDQVSVEPDSSQETISASKTLSNVTSNESSEKLSEVLTSQDTSEEERKEIKKLTQLVSTRETTLNAENNKVNSINAQIEFVEAQLNRWNNEQKTSSVSNSKSSDSGDFKSNSASMPRTSDWISQCSDANALEDYVKLCEQVVAKQMQIEEQKRNAEILLQEIQDEVWRASSNAGAKSRPSSLSVAALGLENIDNDNSSDEEATTTPDALSVSSGKTITPSSVSKTESVAGGLELESARAEMEANLYLGLRLSTELEEVDKLMHNSKNLLQSKGEALLVLVRDLAQSEEGISSDLWDEYGELLAAYDAEVALQQYLVICAENDIARKMIAQSEAEALHKNPHQDFVPDSHELLSASSDALQHALSPWLWCDHCKQELEQAQKYGGFENTDLVSPHWLSHSDVPPNFSSLPLPSPSTMMDSRSSRVPSLLPMPPVPDCNDSDYDDLHSRVHDEEISATSTIISMENSIPRGVVFRHYPTQLLQTHQDSSVKRSTPTVDSLSSSSGNSCSSNPEDSGNASAASTASFTSDTTYLESRHNSCDSGSPKPTSVGTESQDSAHSSPYFARFRNSSKNKFLFPYSNGSKQTSEQNKIRNNKPSKPAVPAKPVGLKPAAGDSNFLEPARRLTRSNSGRNKRSARATTEAFNRRATSFGKGVIKSPNFANPLTGILKKPFVNGDHSSKSNTIKEAAVINNIKNKQPNKSYVVPQTHYSSTARLRQMQDGRQSPGPLHFSVFAEAKNRHSPFTKDQNLIPYDNDSDTGLSSLHSTDSCDRLNATAGETLV